LVNHEYPRINPITSTMRIVEKTAMLGFLIPVG
jgi:hypothetical protein